MADRVTVQIHFRKAWWVCPVCAQEDFEDWSVSGGNTYEHNCSNCGTWFNSFKEYNGILSYPEAEYGSVSSEAIVTAKTTKLMTWVDSVKNPLAVVEPSKEVLEQLKSEKLAELARLQTEIDAKVSAGDGK